MLADFANILAVVSFVLDQRPSSVKYINWFFEVYASQINLVNTICTFLMDELQMIVFTVQYNQAAPDKKFQKSLLTEYLHQ